MHVRKVKAIYKVEAHDIEKAAIEITRGQTIGNPDIHALHETEELHYRHLATYTINGSSIEVNFPGQNFGREGINFLMSVLLGGQCDIDNIKACRLVKLDLEVIQNRFPRPRYGLQGIRELLGVYNRPFLGGIIKPKIGLNPSQIADICLEMAKGGVDFIKEDEVLANMRLAPLRLRVAAATKALKGYKVLYTPCITADGSEIIKKALCAQKYGAGAVHINLWSSLGAYNNLRKNKRFKLPIFFQKSGDKVWTTGPYSIDFKVLLRLVNLIGCDFAHVGMYGGYLAETVEELRGRLKAMRDTIPSFSCGMTPDKVYLIRQNFGNDLMVTSGGYICGHPKGITYACQEFKEAML